MLISEAKHILMLVESPNKVKKITEILKQLGYNNILVMATMGHTTNIKDNRKSYKNSGIWPDQEFKTEYAIIPDKEKLVASIRAQAKQADLVLISSDPDREGENLGNQIKQLLKLSDDKYYRIKYQSITPTAIKYALEHPEKMDTNLIQAAETRQILDKLVGYTLSPQAKAYLGTKSVGRCQSAALKIAVDREKEIRDFIPEQYYDVYLHFEKNNAPFTAKYIGTDDQKIIHLKSEAEAKTVKYNCNSDFIITEIKQNKKTESAKPPFNTLALQQEASRYLNLKVKDIMSLAIKLFENGDITYMRTDAQFLADDFLNELLQYIQTQFNITATKKINNKASTNAQEGHEAIRPTNINYTPEQFKEQTNNQLLYKLYKLIWQRTVASVLPDAVYSETQYIITNNNQKFSFNTSEVLKLGFKQIYNIEVIEEDTPAKTLITFNKDEKLLKCELEAVAKQTQPPSRYSEASLVKALEKYEIGRPSTTASIIETVLDPTRGYATLVNKQIIPTERGIQLSNFLDRAFNTVINLNMTKEMEKNLDQIAQGKLSKLDFLNSFFNILKTAVAQNKEVVQLDKTIKTCPECGAALTVKRNRFGTLFYGCSNYPQCHYTETMQ